MSPQDEQFDDQLPPALRQELMRLHASRARIPSDLDRRILSSARARLARFGRLNLFLRWGGAIGAVAAVVMLAVYIVRPVPSTHAAVAWRADDLNHDRTVDILDAYLLARRVQGGEKMARGDINGDGIIDQRDVDAIARRAVSLTGGQGQ